jgi:hypothetical protein
VPLQNWPTPVVSVHDFDALESGSLETRTVASAEYFTLTAVPGLAATALALTSLPQGAQ